MYKEVVEDQLDLLLVNYTSDKSQLLEILCQNWLQCLPNYNTYPLVIPKVMGMLTHQSISMEVAHMILSFVRVLIVNSLYGQTDKSRELRDLVKTQKEDNSDEDSDPEENEE